MMMENIENRFVTYQFGDTEFIVPSRYRDLSPRGIGAQGTVWYVFLHFKFYYIYLL